MKTQRGFTLLELIIVIAIFGVMSAMAYGGLNSVLKSRVHIEKALERTSELQKSYMRLRNDFQEARNRPVRDGYGDPQPAFVTDHDGNVAFSRAGWRNPMGQPRSSLERVIYRYDTDKKTLIRSSYRVLDQAQDSKPVDQVLLENVEEVQWRYLDANREWGGEWPSRNSHSTTSSTVPPLAVELTLRTTDFGELRYLFRLGMDPLPRGFVPGPVQSSAPPASGPKS